MRRESKVQFGAIQKRGDMKSEAKINVPLLKKIKKHILAEPRRLFMENYGAKVDKTLPYNPPCGTTACIAGWAILLSIPKLKWKGEIERFHLISNDVAGRAAALMGIDRDTAPFF